MEADGCWKMEVQLLEAAGKGSHRWEMVQAAGAEEMGAMRVQPEGAASLARVQPEEGAASVAGRAWVSHSHTLCLGCVWC